MKSSLISELIDLLSRREPTRDEMERFLGERDELPRGEPYPTGWPTIRRCRHCRCAVAGGPTACVRCVARAEGRAEVTADAAFALGMDEERIDRLKALLTEACCIARSATPPEHEDIHARIEAIAAEAK